MLTLKAPAKINWFLKVLGLRDDGYHEIQSLIQKITLYDILTLTLSKELIIRTGVQIPVEQNLIYKTATLLKNKYGVKKGAVIHVEKNIPMGAGLGGGSSDAATTLVGLNELWSLGLSTKELCKVAEQVGSDVPFFLCGSISFVQGRGEKVTIHRAVKPLYILLVKPFLTVSTVWVYKNLSTLSSSVNKFNRDFVSSRHFATNSGLTKNANKVNNIEHFIRNIEKAELSDIFRHSRTILNDLETVTIKSFPIIAEIKERLFKEGALLSLMSGSGPTVFGAFDSIKKAEEASKSFSDFWTAVVQTIID